MKYTKKFTEILFMGIAISTMDMLAEKVGVQTLVKAESGVYNDVSYERQHHYYGSDYSGGGVPVTSVEHIVLLVCCLMASIIGCASFCLERKRR